MTPARSMSLAFLLAGALAAVPGHAATQSNESFGIYGYVHRVVREPDSSKPTRIQVWGTFSVAVPGSSDYHAPERGYLYFELPTAGAATALEEWAALGKPGDGIVGFTSPGARPRVRTANEKPQQPDPYRAGKGIVRMRPGDRTGGPSALVMLGRLLANEALMNYALVDSVAIEPNDAEPERVHICGAFALGTEFAGYAPARRGCLFVALPEGSANVIRDTLDEWAAWRSVAGSGQIVGFVTLDGQPQIRLRPADGRPPVAPDSYSISIDWSVVRSDSTYGPVRALLSLGRS
jgi:hypothetical protein